MKEKMSMRKSLILLLLLLFIASVLAAEGDSGQLDELEKELNKPADEQDNDESENSSSDDDDNFFCFLFRMLFYELFIGIPEDKAARSEFLWGHGFNDYPYSPGDFGAYSIYSTKYVRLNLSTKYLRHSKDLDGHNLRGNFFFTPFFNLEGSYLHLEEDLQSETDKLDIYDLYFNYIRFHSEYVLWWWGLGIKHLRGDDLYTGFSLNTGWEIYLLRPLSIDLRLNNAFINYRLVNEINCNLKLYIYNFYIQAGYLREAAGSKAISAVTAGIGFNF